MRNNIRTFQVSRFRFQVHLKHGTWNLKHHRNGQTTLEYAVVIAVVAAALLSMQIYMKRGVQGRLRSATDQVGDQFVPTTTTSTYTVTSSSNRRDVALTNGSSTSTLNQDEVQTRSGSETVDTSGQTKLF